MSLWFRAYVSVLDPDDKTRDLTDRQFRNWHLLLALFKKSGGRMPSTAAISRALSIPLGKVEGTLSELADATLFDRSNGEWVPHNWKKRQFDSDVSTERVRGFRERRNKKDRNVSLSQKETPPENRVQNTLPLPPLSPAEQPGDLRLDDWAEKLYSRHPRKKDKPLVESILCEIITTKNPDNTEEFLAMVDAAHERKCASQDWRKDGGKYVPSLAKWLSDEGWTEAVSAESESDPGNLPEWRPDYK